MSKNHLHFLWLILYAVFGFLSAGTSVGNWNFFLAPWFAPAFAMRFFRGSEKPKRDFLVLWFVSAVLSLSWWGAAPTFMIPIIIILFIPLGLLLFVIDRIYFRRFGPQFWVTLVYPVAATGMDYLFNGNSPMGTFGATAYSQHGFLPIMQLSSLAGLWGIAFVMNWFASAVNYVWENGFRRPVLIYASVLILVFGFGVMRMQSAPQPEHTPLVAGFSLPNGKLNELPRLIFAGDETEFRQKTDKLHRQELAQIRDLAGKGAKIVVLQEGAGLGYPDQVEKLLADAMAIAREMEIFIVLPTYTFSPPPVNMVRIIDPKGRVVLEHVKYGGNMVERTLKGNGVLKSIETPYGKLSAIICWDADFPNIVRQAGKQGVELLFISANDWLEVRNIHAGMAAFRAVENGMSIFRQAGSGVSLATDAYGREISRVDSFEDTSPTNFEAVHIETVPATSVSTIYPQIGDAFGQIMLVGLAAVLIGILKLKKEKL